MRAALLAAFLLAACAGHGPTQDHSCPDADGDGHRALSCGGDDCDDSDPAVHPGAPELCTGDKDENCDGHVNEGCLCVPGVNRPCYPGPPGTESTGACHPGAETCTAEGRWGECEGAVVPMPEPAACDGIDQDCNGRDEGACGCVEGGVEICGNGLDDNCNHTIDDPSYCAYSCQGVSRNDPPPELECCRTEPPSRLSATCTEVAGMPSCAERACVSSDAAIHCDRICQGDRCECRMATPGGHMTDDRCGFETPCNRLGCEGRQHQPCYTGPPATAGKGTCHGGFTDCTGGAWGSCEGQSLPGIEVCNNGLDDDCDGLIDEEDGTTHEACPPGNRVCDVVETCGDGVDSDCNGKGGPGEPEDPGCCTPSTEVCNGLDDDCDGLVDEGLLGACGSCDKPCVDLSLDSPGDCSVPGRTCESTTFAAGQVRVDAVVLPPPSHALGASDFNGDLVLFDTSSAPGQAHELWRKSGLGTGEVALAADGSMWLWDGLTVHHLDRQGNLICEVDLPPSPGDVDGGLVLDGLGNAWVVTELSMKSSIELRRVHRSATVPVTGEVDRCVSIQPTVVMTYPVGVATFLYGAFDGGGHLWMVASRGGKRLDTTSGVTDEVGVPESPAAATMDPSDRMFMGGAGGVDRIAPTPDVADQYTFRLPGVTALAAAGGVLWAATQETSGFSLNAVDPVLGVQNHRVRLTGPAPREMAVDDEGRLWALSSGLHRFDPAGAWEDFTTERLYVSAASTDTAPRRLASRVAALTQLLDSGTMRTRWLAATFDVISPTAGAAVTLRFADDPLNLSGSPNVCGPYAASPADLSSCDKAIGRYAQAEIVVYADASGASSSISGLRLTGDLP